MQDRTEYAAITFRAEDDSVNGNIWVWFARRSRGLIFAQFWGHDARKHL